jgi:hypothetical protein
MAEEISKRTVVYSMPAVDLVRSRRDGPIDIYERRPAKAAVVIVAGYPDAGVERIFGCSFREMGATVSWARLIAASGIAAIAYTNREIELEAVIERLQMLGVERIGIFATSGNAPRALPLIMKDSPAPIAAAVLCYPYTLDVPPEGKQFGFATPCDQRTVDEIRNDVPLLIVRAGRDEIPGLNVTLDAFIRGALTANLPLTLLNHPTGPHAFDLVDDTEATRDVIGQILDFLKKRMTGTG